MIRGGTTINAALVIVAMGLAQPVWAQDKMSVASDLTTKNVRKQESGLANVIADAIRDSANSDIAFAAASSFSDHTIPKGSAGVDDVLLVTSRDKRAANQNHHFPTTPVPERRQLDGHDV